MVSLYSRAPSFRVKTLNWLGEARWDGEWYYHFRLDYEWNDMEWVDLKPKSTASAVALDEIEEICRRMGLEIERHEDLVRIIGYREI